jgi:transposase-like protein
MSRVNQSVLPLLPARARSAGLLAGLLEGPDGGVVFVFGLATFSYASADQTGRRLAAVQLVTTKIASVAEVASAFGVNEATLWRWKQAFGTGGVVGLVAERPGPRRPSKLTTSLATLLQRQTGRRQLDDPPDLARHWADSHPQKPCSVYCLTPKGPSLQRPPEFADP